MHAQLIFVEGLPGTGKTTTAAAIHRSIVGRGGAASWWIEEAADHPATPKTLRRTAAVAGFPERCLAHWRSFVEARRSASEYVVLDGSAFQSTIRFMLEYEVPRAEILRYAHAFADSVGPLEPRFVYLEPGEARAFLSEFVYPVRGPEWVAKVSAYLAGTPCCRVRGWSGPAGMLEFWLLYRDLCEEALAALRLPTLRLTVGPGHWPRAEASLSTWLPSA